MPDVVEAIEIWLTVSHNTVTRAEEYVNER